MANNQALFQRSIPETSLSRARDRTESVTFLIVLTVRTISWAKTNDSVLGKDREGYGTSAHVE